MCERRNVSRSDEDARAAIVHEVADSSDRSCDHGKTERHCFEHDHRQPLAARGKAEHVRARVMRSEAARTNGAGKRDHLVQAVAMNGLAQPLLFTRMFFRSYERQLGVDTVRPNTRKRVD